MNRTTIFFLYWFPVIGWGIVIAALSSDSFSSSWSISFLERVANFLSLSIAKADIQWANRLFRPFGHMFIYAVLTLLGFRAWRCGNPSGWQGTWALASFLLTLAVAGADELNQTRLLTRTGSLTGVGQDIIGSLLALGGIWVLAGLSEGKGANAQKDGAPKDGTGESNGPGESRKEDRKDESTEGVG